MRRSRSFREAQECAVKNKKRATRGSPQVATKRPKRHAATPQDPVDIMARSDNQQSRCGQDLACGISPPAGRLLRARKRAPADSDPWEDLTRRRMAGAVIYELKNEYGYKVSLQDVADTHGLPNRHTWGGCLAYMPRAISNGNIEIKFISKVLNVFGQCAWRVRII